MEEDNKAVVPEEHSPDNKVIEADFEEKKVKIRLTVETRKSAYLIRVYAEHFDPYVDHKDNDAMYEVLKNHMCGIVNFPKDIFVTGAIHDMDYDRSDYANPKPLKVHGHILMASLRKDKNGRVERIRWGQVLHLLKQYLGLSFRPKEDDAHIQTTKFPTFNHCADNTSVYALSAYMNHDTYDAREDGKYLYLSYGSNPNWWTNNPDLLRDWIDRYHKTCDYTRTEKGALKKVTDEVKIRYKEEAYELGKRGGDYLGWYMSLPSVVHVGGLESLLTKWYDLGVSEFLCSDAGLDHIRCAIYICGRKDLGKTYCSRKALINMGYRGKAIKNNNTGMFDHITAQDQFLVLDDVKVNDPLSVFDDDYCQLYRRNSGNPLWTGDYVVITANKNIDAYIKDHYSNMCEDEQDAIKSRLFICRCDEYGLHLSSSGDRGTAEKIKKRTAMFNSFCKEFNALQQSFMKDKIKMRVSDPVVKSNKPVDDGWKQVSIKDLPIEWQ